VGSGEDDAWDGDAPVAAPLDAPRANEPRPVDDLSSLFRPTSPVPPADTEVTQPFAEGLRTRTTDPAPSSNEPPTGPIFTAAAAPSESMAFEDTTSSGVFSRDQVVELQRAPQAAPSPAPRRPPPREPSRSRSGIHAPPGVKPAREYPRMKSLLSAPVEAAAPEPLERGSSTARTAFVRGGSKTSERPQKRGELDGMLEEMAQGLLVGGPGGQLSEMRVTLRDEFFRGTELIIAVAPEGVTARFLPPDRETYRNLSSELGRLRAHLEEKGLRVARLEVDEP
jgi:hypothetical protein